MVNHVGDVVVFIPQVMELQDAMITYAAVLTF